MVAPVILQAADGFTTVTVSHVQQQHQQQQGRRRGRRRRAIATTTTSKLRAIDYPNRLYGSRSEAADNFQDRQALYDQMRMKAACSTKNVTRSPSIWSFEALFPKPVWDEEIIQKDLWHATTTTASLGSSGELNSSSSINRYFSPSTNQQTTKTKQPIASSSTLLTSDDERKKEGQQSLLDSSAKDPTSSVIISKTERVIDNCNSTDKSKYTLKEQQPNTVSGRAAPPPINSTSSNDVAALEPTIPPAAAHIDVELSRKVKDRVYGMRTISSTTGPGGANTSPIYDYDTSLIDASRAVQFTADGRRIGRALKINIDTLTYTAKRAFRKQNVKLAEQLYLRAVTMDPFDGRPYLGLSRCAEKRQDLVAARNYLKMGIRKSIYNSNSEGGVTKNPFLLQALGTLEEKVGHLAEAERLYVAAINSQPSHAAAWVALAQLRTEKLRQSVDAGRSCYESAKRELALAGLPPSPYVYAAWAALEWKRAGNVKLARSLFHQAIAVDPKCSAAFLQLGVMEAEARNWEKAKDCFESVLKFDNRNSRVLQAFAIMESKRPDGDSRTAIGLFEQALKVNSKDAGVFQAYALYVASLGDIDAAKNL